jgi:hypothetical protein
VFGAIDDSKADPWMARSKGRPYSRPEVGNGSMYESAVIAGLPSERGPRSRRVFTVGSGAGVIGFDVREVGFTPEA